MRREGEKAVDREPLASQPTFRHVSELAWRLLFVAAAFYVVGIILSRLWLVVLPVVLALFLASVLQPAVGRLIRRGLPPLAAAWIVMLAGVAVVGGAVFFAVQTVYENAGELSASVAEGWDVAADLLERSPLELSVDDLRGAMSDFGADNGAAIARRIFTGAFALIELMTVLVLTMFFTFFFIKDGERLFLGATDWVGDDRREVVREAGRRVWRTLSTFMRNQAFIALINAVQTGVVLTLLDVPLALPIAVLTFMASFIPFVGPVVAGAAGGLVALSDKGLGTALLFVAIEFVYEQIEGNVLEPMILGQGLKLHPTVVAGSVTTGALVAGIPGAFLAVPLASAVFTLVEYRREKTAQAAPEGPGEP